MPTTEAPLTEKAHAVLARAIRLAELSKETGVVALKTISGTDRGSASLWFVDGELVETCAYPLAQVVRPVNVAVPGVFEGLPEALGKCPTPGCPYYQSPNVGAWSPAQTCCRPCKVSGNHGGLCDS